MERLASKWRVLVVHALLAGPQRHAEYVMTVLGKTLQEPLAAISSTN
ncbi:hypothetical protein AB0J72_22825 [Dactylosporangium sp. NPDC049742]